MGDFIMAGYGIRDEELWIDLKVFFIRIEVLPNEDILGRDKFVGIYK